ncbi:MAG: 30S ribosomal protein S6 [Spirochaetales bacterium]|nr:30S ribosomal protein S6 [Spirochaetales bacterium]
MRNYEIVFVFKDEEEAFKQGKELVNQELTRIEAVISKEDDMGSRDLAYSVKKENRGHYYVYFFQAEPEKVPTLDKAFKLSRDILKYLFIRDDD